MRFLKKPSVILGIYIAYLLILLVFYLWSKNIIPEIVWIRVIEIPIVGIISSFAIKGKQWALWIMGLFLFINVWGILFGLFVSWNQYIVKSVSFIMGCYFVYGGFVLVGLARKKEGKSGEQPHPADARTSRG